MSQSDLFQAKMYLRPPERSIWSWSERGDAVQWSSGVTIAFVDELKQILRHQTENGTRGLPPFGALLFLVAATRQNWNEKAHREARMFQFEYIVQLKSRNLLEEVSKGLDLVNELASENKVSIEAKQTLVDLVFKKTMRTSIEVANEVIRILDCSVEEIVEGTEHAARPKASDSILRDLRTLERGLKRLDEEVLALRRETGIDKLPITDEAIEIPENPSPGELFSELEADRELYAIGRAARQMYSVLSLPQPSFHESELEQGGVSDIANRGPLDRLLLSELAHDDLTLAVRVAVNEAMYLRRESPPQTSQPRQLIVLDSGLKNWGMPRLLGTAMGLALAARSNDDDQEHEVFSAKKDQLESVSLTNREGIVGHLKTLRPELDLSECFAAVEGVLNESESDCDLVLITNERTANGESFSLRLNQANLFNHPRLSRLFLGSVSRGGESKLIEINQVGRKVVKQLTFDLDRLMQDAPKATAIDRSGNFPALIGLERMPLRMSYGKVLQNFVWPIGPDRIILLTGDGRFLYFTDRNKGGEQLSDHIATAQVWWFSKRPIDGVWSAVIGHPARKDYRLVNFDFDRKTIDEVPLEINENLEGFCSHQGSLFVLHSNKVSLIDRSSGQSTKSLRVSEYKWTGGRFFRSVEGNTHYALASNGTAPVLEPVPIPWERLDLAICPVHLYETPCIEGPIAVRLFPEGEIHFVATGETIQLKTERTVKNLHSLVVGDTDPFRNELTIQSRNGGRPMRVDVLTGDVKGQFYPTLSFLQTQANRLISPNQLRHRFRSATVTSDGTFRLASKNQPRLNFKISNGLLMLEDSPIVSSEKFERQFQPVESPNGTRYDLKVARWKDGSEAWLDSRGMLHLRSSDPDIAEITMTLSHGACAGWCSDGTVFGMKFHVGDGPQKPLDEVILLIECFCGHIVNS